MSSLMASLTSPVNLGHDHPTSSCSSSSKVHSLPRLATNSSLNSEASCNSISSRTLSASSSCSQVSSGSLLFCESRVVSDSDKTTFFSSNCRRCRGSPVTSSPSSPLTQLPESFPSLLPPPPPPLLFPPSQSPPPSPAAPPAPCNQSGLTPAITLPNATPPPLPITSPLLRLQTPSLSLATRLRTTGPPPVAPAVGRPGATSPSPQAPVSTAARLGVTGAPSHRI